MLTPLADTADADVTGVPLLEAVFAVVKELGEVMAGVLELVLEEVVVVTKLELVLV